MKKELLVKAREGSSQSNYKAVIKGYQDNEKAVIHGSQTNCEAVIKGSQYNYKTNIKGDVCIYGLKNGDAETQKILDEFSKEYEKTPMDATLQNLIKWLKKGKRLR